jgi:hypothetical protein
VEGVKPTSTAIAICSSIASTIVFSFSLFAADPVAIHLAHNSWREMETSLRLRQIPSKYDLQKYTFMREVIIEEGTMNHGFPVLTLNLFFGDRADELLSTYLHEQLHWYLREHDTQRQAAIIELRQLNPHVPVESHATKPPTGWPKPRPEN